MKLSKLYVGGALALGLVLAGPASAFAQACVGMPIGSSKSAVSLNFAFPEEATDIGASARMRTSGPLSFGASYSMTSIKDVDPKMHNLGGNVSYDLPVSSAAVCAVGGLGYSRISEDGESLSNLSIPIGAGIGYSVQTGPDAELVPYAVPHILWQRASFAGFTDSSTDFGVNFGATYRMQQILINAGVTVTSVEGSKAVFGLGLGYAL